MRAITQERFGGPEVLYTTEVPRPVPLPTEVLVRVHAAAVNPIDVKTRQGEGVAEIIGAPPFVLGWDVSGVVADVGYGVTMLNVGDEVMGMPWFPRAAGAYAEYVSAPSRQFTRKPPTLSHEQAAAVPMAALTAWQMLTAADVRPGQRVLVHAGAGGVGHFVVQFAKLFGAYVIGTARAEKHAWLKQLGVDQVIDYSTDRFEQQVDRVDVVVDLVGDIVDHTSTRSVYVLKQGGLLISALGISPDLIDKAASADVRARSFIVEPDGATLSQIASLIEQGCIHVAVEQVFALQDVGLAHQHLATSRTRGKLVLRAAD